jgi:hypothetical protein
MILKIIGLALAIIFGMGKILYEHEKRKKTNEHKKEEFDEALAHGDTTAMSDAFYRMRKSKGGSDTSRPDDKPAS